MSNRYFKPYPPKPWTGEDNIKAYKQRIKDEFTTEVNNRIKSEKNYLKEKQTSMIIKSLDSIYNVKRITSSQYASFIAQFWFTNKGDYVKDGRNIIKEDDIPKCYSIYNQVAIRMKKEWETELKRRSSEKKTTKAKTKCKKNH